MRRICFAVLVTVAVYVAAGCATPSAPVSEKTPDAQVSSEAQVRQLKARNDELEARIKELEARNKELANRLSPETRTVNLINPNYPPAVAGATGWEYHQTLSADLDGDGEKERVAVTTNAAWMPELKEFAWDDGHPWHVYVEEADGGRTYLFSNWIQLGRLDVILDREGPGLFILSSRGGGLEIYRATYEGPGQVITTEAFSIPLSVSATWADR
ncbi:MAG TPA: hypothetical protein VD973_26130 [Symbiobacteriaceae bacterium]|jgi:hypothetical protein|nr:hypothetical protein [Symbiobacteriaceae bacterium]